jgi:hypothetical protein
VPTIPEANVRESRVPTKVFENWSTIGGGVDQWRAEGGAEIIEEDETRHDPEYSRADGATNGRPSFAELALADLARGLADYEDSHGKGNRREDSSD